MKTIKINKCGVCPYAFFDTLEGWLCGGDISTKPYIVRKLIHDMEAIPDFCPLPNEQGVDVWLARDEDNELYIFHEKPVLMRGGGTWMYPDTYVSFDEQFPSVTFENSPVKARIIINEE